MSQPGAERQDGYRQYGHARARLRRAGSQERPEDGAAQEGKHLPVGFRHWAEMGECYRQGGKCHPAFAQLCYSNNVLCLSLYFLIC